MAKIEGTIYCDGCGVEILLAPVMKDQKVYCCLDCSQGFACTCGERIDLEQSEL